MGIPASTVLLSEDGLLDTYDEERTPHQTVEQYRRANELRKGDPERSRASIAREVGRPPSTLRRWLVDGAKPSEIKAIETAEQYNWLPLHSDDRIFDAINQLTAWVYGGGWINPDTFQPSITVNHRLHFAIARHVIDPLGNDWRSIRDDTTKTQELRPRDGGAVLGRLLHAIGAPIGRKSDQTLTLPSYLNRVDAYHRQQFARMYLVHRGAPANTEGVGLTIQETRSKEYFYTLQALFEDVTEEPITLNDSIPKLFISTAAVQALAGNTTDPKPALAYRLAYKNDETLVSDRAFVDTYESSYRNPWTVVQQYREAMRRNETNAEVTEAQLARDIGVSQPKLRSWTTGGKPYSVNGLDKAQQRGWVGIEPSGKTFLALNRLVAWLFSAGYLSASNMHPRFLVGSETHQRVLESILETLDIDALIQKSNTTPEVHPRTDGAILGRTLHVMGVLVPEDGENPLLSLPVYLHAVSQQIRRDFANVYLLNRAELGDSPAAGFTLAQPKYPSQYLDDLYTFLDELTEGPISRDDERITLTTEAILSIAPGFDETAPKESIASELGIY